MKYVFLITNFVLATGLDHLIHKHRSTNLTKVSDGLYLNDININYVSLAHPKIHSFNVLVCAASQHGLSPQQEFSRIRAFSKIPTGYFVSMFNYYMS